MEPTRKLTLDAAACRERKDCKMIRFAFGCYLIGLSVFASATWSQERSGPARPADLPIAAGPYTPREEVSGELRIVGASTLRPLAGLWREEFAKFHHAAKLNMQLDGSETAAPILAKEKNVVAILSRQYLPEEIAQIEKESNGKVYQFVIAYDVLGVIVNKANPIEGLTRAQARSLLRKGTDKEKETSVWGDVGVQGDFAKLKIVPHGRSKTSGTRTYVKRLVLNPEEEERDQESHASFSSIADSVESEKGAVGYVSLSHLRKDKVKVLGVSREAGEPFVFPTDENITSGKYPLVRPLVLVAVGGESGLADKTLVEAIHFMISERGQMQVLKDGFLPATRTDIVHGLDMLGISSVK
jgi:phosphate transport system substrate-binding protein